ncbi:hypothetical protein LSH36_1270g00002, partial [Paralvinella palmiformis]
WLVDGELHCLKRLLLHKQQSRSDLIRFVPIADLYKNRMFIGNKPLLYLAFYWMLLEYTEAYHIS